MTRRLALASATGLLALVSLPALASATAIPGPNGKIAFASARPAEGVPSPNTGDAGSRIFVADYPSGTPVQVTTLPAGEKMRHRQPNWSPDHTRIAYAAGLSTGNKYALWVKDLRTGSQTELVPEMTELDRPSWSPDGSQIAFGALGDLWVVSLTPGSEPVQITNTIGIAEERPVWSPDGNTLYYDRGAEGSKDIYKKSPVTLGGAEEPVIATAANEWQPAISPNGNRLCYLSGPKNDEATLRTVNVNGTGDGLFRDDSTRGDLNCVWSPDGTTILYTEGAFGLGELRTRDINGGSFDLHNSYNVEGHFDGNADWATNFPPTCDSKNLTIAPNAFVTVKLSCTDPDAGVGAEPPTPTPIDESELEIVTLPAHGTLGGITKDEQVVYTPNKDFEGTDSFTFTGSDSVSNAKPATVTINVRKAPAAAGDKTPPVISGLAVSPRRWRLGRKLATISRVRLGTTISFRLSEAARTTLTFQRRRPGRKVGRSCVKPTPANSGNRRCTRFVSVGSLGFQAKAGLRHVRFQGRLSGARSLGPGSYRLVASARDAAGNQGATRVGPTFTIVRE